MAAVIPEWCQRLRVLRESSGLTREALAARALVSANTIKAYEINRRNPSRQLLTALLDAMRVERHDRNFILSDAGFAPDSTPSTNELPTPEFSVDEAVIDIARSPWPAFITNEAMAVVAANHVAQEVWSIDLEREFRTPVERHLLNVMTQPRFADRIVNFDESARLLASMVKGSFGEAAAAPGGPAPYLAAVMEHMMKGELKYLQRFLMIWSDAPARIHKWRFTYPIIWAHPTAGTMRFRCLVNPVNRADYLAINDWMPVDGETWEALGRLDSAEAAARRHRQ